MYPILDVLLQEYAIIRTNNPLRIQIEAGIAAILHIIYQVDKLKF